MTTLIAVTSLAPAPLRLPFAASHSPGSVRPCPISPLTSRRVATRFFAAIEAGDIDALRAIYSPDAVVWHNTDQVEQSVDENLVVLRWVDQNVKGWRYEDVRRTVVRGRLRAAAHGQGHRAERASPSRCRRASSGMSRAVG